MIYFVDFAKRNFELWPSRGTARADAVPCLPVENRHAPRKLSGNALMRVAATSSRTPPKSISCQKRGITSTNCFPAFGCVTRILQSEIKHRVCASQLGFLFWSWVHRKCLGVGTYWTISWALVFISHCKTIEFAKENHDGHAKRL